MEKKKILLLLSKFSDFKSRAIGFLTGFYFTHASIGLGEDKNTFYSFVDKGFIVERFPAMYGRTKPPPPANCMRRKYPMRYTRRSKTRCPDL